METERVFVVEIEGTEKSDFVWDDESFLLQQVDKTVHAQTGCAGKGPSLMQEDMKIY